MPNSIFKDITSVLRPILQWAIKSLSLWLVTIELCDIWTQNDKYWRNIWNSYLWEYGYYYEAGHDVAQ